MSNKRKTEQGVALIASLALIFTAGLLVGGIVLLSQTSTLTIVSSCDIIRSNYTSEGAANRIRFLIEADRYKFAATTSETNYDQYEHDRYLPDGVEHVLDYYGTPVTFRIWNGNRGVDMNSNYQNTLNTLCYNVESGDILYNDKEIFSNRIRDYRDSDDSISIDGMEENDYELLGMNNLPRNEQMQLREELLWIPNATQFLPLDKHGLLSFVRLFTIDAGRTLPDIYSANYAILRTFGQFDETKSAQIMRALDIWRRERITLEDQLDGTLLLEIKQRFSFNDSGIYTIEIENATGKNQPSSRLIQTFQSQGIAGPSDKIVRYLEYMKI